MKIFCNIRSLALAVLFLIAPVLFFHPALAAEDGVSGNRVTVNFQDVDISTVINSVSKITGRTFIVDPRVKGNVTVVASKDVAEEDLYDLFLAVLQVQGFAAIDENGIVRIVPLARVKSDSSMVEIGDGAVSRPPDSMVTKIYKLKYAQADKLVAILRPLVDTKSYLASQTESNMLIITDRAANVDRLMKIVEQVDQGQTSDIEVIKLKYADAKDAVKIIEGLLPEQVKGTTQQDVRLIADERTNSILLSGSELTVMRIRTLVSHLDEPIELEGATQVVFLKYAKAIDLLPILQGGKFEETEPGQVAKNLKVRDSQNTEVNVQADEATNALIITASPATTKNILSVIRKLDFRRPQVLIEAVIAEIATGDGAEFGVQWQATDVTTDNQSGLIGGTSFTGTSVPNINVLSTGDLSSLGAVSGFNLGFLNGTRDILGVTGLNLGALISALSSDSNSNILSTPSIVTMDNKEAEIVVGQNVPFSTGSYTSTTNGTVESPFTTYERQDVGLKLKVLPQITDGDTIRLDIDQEVSNLVSTSSDSIIGLQTTSTREIRTSVMVDDGKILVLGGLISDDIQETEQRVPLLGSIPLVGWLFRYNKTTHDKRNLMVFLRPTILRDTAANDRITFSKYDYMRRLQQEFSDKGISLLPDNQSPLLPE